MRLRTYLLIITTVILLSLVGLMAVFSGSRFSRIYAQGPTEQQQTVEGVVNQFFTQTAQADQRFVLTQTIAAAFGQALTATAASQQIVPPSATIAPSLAPITATDPLNLLNGYLAAVNTKDYKTAYTTFLYPRATYNSFVAGWKYTQTVQGSFGAFQPYRGSNERGDVPGLLILTLTNGGIETYHGCYFMISVNNTWYVEDFDFKLLFKRQPTSSDITAFTSLDCSNLRAAMGMNTLLLPEYLDGITQLKELKLPIFRVGYVVVVAVDNVNVRDRSTSAANAIAQLNSGDTVTIIGGPEKSIRFVWWEVKLQDGTIGWVAALSDNGTQTLTLP